MLVAIHPAELWLYHSEPVFNFNFLTSIIMKKILLILITASVASISSCKKSQFSDNYPDPSKVASTTVEKQFAGFLAANQDYVMYKYWNYFVILQNTLLPWTQTVGIVNAPGRYVPGAAAISDRWSN